MQHLAKHVYREVANEEVSNNDLKVNEYKDIRLVLASNYFVMPIIVWETYLETTYL